MSKPEALRLAELIDEPYPLHSQMPMAAAELRRLHAEVEALRADAGRLAWMYSGKKTESGALVTLELRLIAGEPVTLDEARAAIDAAMAKEQTK